MIKANINDLNTYNLLSKNDRLKFALDYLKANNFVETPGKNIVNDDMFTVYNSIDTKEYDGVYEAHRKYIDIFYVIDGNEEIYVESLNNIKVTKEYDEESDCLLGNGNDNFTKVKLAKGDFVVLYPEDGHSPAKGDGSHLVKLIVKVRV